MVDVIGKVEHMAGLQGFGIGKGSAIILIGRELTRLLIGQGLIQERSCAIEVIDKIVNRGRLILVVIGLGETEQQNSTGLVPATAVVEVIGNRKAIGMVAVVGMPLIAQP